MTTRRRNTDPHNYQSVVQHEGDERPTRQSCASADTAYGHARRAFRACDVHEHEGCTVQLVRKTDGKVLWDGPAGVEVDWREW